MAFDINTARPEGGAQPVKSGFDINSSRSDSHGVGKFIIFRKRIKILEICLS